MPAHEGDKCQEKMVIIVAQTHKLTWEREAGDVGLERIEYISNVEHREIPSNRLILCIHRDRPKIIAKFNEWVSVLRLKRFLHFKCVIAFPLERCLAHENSLYHYPLLHS